MKIKKKDHSYLFMNDPFFFFELMNIIYFLTILGGSLKKIAKNITIKTNQKIKFNLLYDQNKSLQKKIKIEQLRRETS